MYKDKNELYKDVALEVTIDAKRGAKNQEIETHATFYSYDVQSGLIKINIKKDSKPLPLPNGTQVLLSVVKLDLPQQKMVFTGDIVDSTEGIVHWVIPDELQGYKGAIRTGVFVKLPNDQSLHGGYFKFYMGISEIDENLEPFEENYWQGWHDFQEEAEKEWNAWKASRDKTWKKQEEAYNEWKKEQENKQTQYENDTDERWNKWKNQQEKAQSEFESNFVSWKSTQEERQTGFEREFADWQDTQESKQTQFENDFSSWEKDQEKKQDNFESSVSSKHTQINNDIEKIDQRVEETNEELESLDAYSKTETDSKLNDKADKSDLNSKAEKEDISNLEDKIDTYYDNLFETEVLYDGMEDNLGIYFDESHSFSIDQNKKVEKVVFWWSRYDIGNAPKNYAFNNTIVDGETLRALQKQGSTMRVPFKPTESDTTSFKNIDFIKKGVKGSTKNTQSNVGDRDNRWIVLRKLYVVYRKEV
ncbi:BppU family phage baseplate upper protein [Tetragenococcus halophilus]|uniref:BppU family phage baseplate upper protein n=1 Tax=Tetragenococcus halophilus TaxID=51669 RepID=UPI0015BC8087|nr:BppU family phage baseplate upper protein [Tetragenococcus halophilus]NWO01275.1 BppU family phage baseplate upper protein [Tetragenococcus halophilus]